MLLEEGPAGGVRSGIARHGEATRRAVRAWELELLCRNPDEYSNSLTAIMLPDGHDADRFRRIVLERFDMSLGTGLGKLAGKVFRIGHLGFFNDLTLAGDAVRASRWASRLAGVPHRGGGVQAALGVPRRSRRRKITTRP